MLSPARLLSWSILAALVVAVPASAAVPDPPHSTSDPIVVGDSNGQLIQNGYQVIVRDLHNAPLAGRTVVLHFNGNARPYTAQVAPAIASCPTVSKVTDASGFVQFQVRMGGYDNVNVVQVVADGVVLNTVRARSTDLTGDGLTGAFDLVHFRNNFLNNPTAPETDYNRDGTTDPFDFNIFRSVFLNDIPGTPCP